MDQGKNREFEIVESLTEFFFNIDFNEYVLLS